MLKPFLTIIFYLVLLLPLVAQEADTAKVNEDNAGSVIAAVEGLESFTTQDTTHSPRLAAMYSAAIPGLGQFYNKKYWKIPLVYSLGAFAAYQIKTNHYNYLFFLNALNNFSDGNPETDILVQPFRERNYTVESINRRVERYKRDRDYWIILAGLIYVLNIVDATVDAHLREFNINEDLSLHIEPAILRSENNQMHGGLTFNFQLK